MLEEEYLLSSPTEPNINKFSKTDVTEFEGLEIVCKGTLLKKNRWL
jgi:hypothetical protein